MERKEIVEILLSILSLLVSFVAIWISTKEYRRKNNINKAILYCNNFINIYTYLFKKNINCYDKKWTNSDLVLSSIYKQKIFDDSIKNIFPNINNINYYSSLNFSEEEKFKDIIDKSFINLHKTLENCTNKKIKKNKKYWKLYYKKINKIQKYLIDKLELFSLKINKNKSELVSKKITFKEFWLEFNNFNDISNLVFKSRNNFQLKLLFRIKNKFFNDDNEIKNFKKIVFLLEILIPKINKCFIKSNIYTLNFQNKDSINKKIYYKGKEIK